MFTTLIKLILQILRFLNPFEQRQVIKKLIFVLFIFYQATDVLATHIRAGEITARRIGCTGRTYEFIITAYRDTGSDILFGNGVLSYGDGQTLSLNPDSFFRKELIDDEVELVQFRQEHTYESNGIYIVSYNEDFRNVGIANISNSGSVAFYVETIIRLDPALGCNDSPIFLIPPVDKAAIGVAFFHNPGAFDINPGDSISFRFVIPKSRTGVNVPGYRSPEIASGGQDSQQIGPATFTLDQLTGDIIWDAPALKGEFNIAFIAEEWRKINGEWVFLGSITRDMQIIVDETDNDPPEIIIPEDTCVEAGTLLEATITATDINDESLVQIEGFGGPFILEPPAVLIPDSDGYFESPHSVQFSWQTNCDQIRAEPYQVRFKAEDNGPGIRLTDYKTWNITIVPPSPKNVTIETRPQRSLRLSWDNYDCGLAEVIQVYRRVDSFAFTPENCEIGIPENGGYELIEAVPVAQNSYTDNNAGRGLDFGATYCYRLVAVFELPNGAVSYASEEVCEKIAATGPIITNVSVNETGISDGAITVSWLPPFEIDQAIYPPPYKYQLLRNSGGNFEVIAIVSDDTTYVDSGINTEEQIFTYKIELYLEADEVNNDNLIEVSANASSIEMNSVSLFETIELLWDADVPWSNTNQDFPYHYIYRDKVSTANPEQLVLIDSVDVTVFGYNYVDSGAFNNQRLSNNETYCYYVTTQGTYGNEDIFDPLVNDGPIYCTMPDDNIDPCPPFEASFELDSEDACKEFLANKSCDFNDFQNTIFWTTNEVDTCDASIVFYEIFYQNELTDEFTLVGTSTDTVFLHDNLPEYKGCYKIRAVDRSGNRSVFSNTFCKENCPNIAFPNVITPGNSLGKNDVFTPFYPGANSAIPLEFCPRFLEQIEFNVYNRYGKLVYAYTSGGENSLYINWEGVNNSGQELPSATYFFEVIATFDMLRPENKTRFYKGQVQILR